jgi:hypothetical protein
MCVWLGLFRFVSTTLIEAEGAGCAAELNVVDQRYRAVLEVLDGATVTDVVVRYMLQPVRTELGDGLPLVVGG